MSDGGSTLVITAHAGEFVWHAGGAIALAASRGEKVTVACLTVGEHGESGRAWREGKSLEAIKQLRNDEARRAADVLGVDLRFYSAEDYPLIPTRELLDELVRLYREIAPTAVLTHPLNDPYNVDHPAAARVALDARVLAQAAGYPAEGKALGAPPVFFFEPQQPEMCGFQPQVLLDITEVYHLKRKAMEALPAKHQWEYYSELAQRRGVQLRRNAGRNLTLPATVYAEAYMRHFPQVATVLA
ncbi:PIG-L deacetylase family protein [Dactylosporangium sp. AC04546]|uniref:PIG-L deacetylase family protein n=1 Tax=Dactylosporangium sp. AC04546 TaxID=2862460 RepID=UPI001EDD561D|nr:PIG-L deacetylase family protein [Dactylosporangium sp. AC04546]WVK79520.1 PIG-L deacetylase family protein [Dactylosporangium sp. AC04546]